MLGRSAGQLLGDQLGRRARPRHWLGISYDYDGHDRSQQLANFTKPVLGVNLALRHGADDGAI
jgi:hypothetical protein